MHNTFSPAFEYKLYFSQAHLKHKINPNEEAKLKIFIVS